MKAVILGKAGSGRVSEKNYRPFYQNEFLLDILIGKLAKKLDEKDIYLSYEREKYRYVSDRWNINFVHRDEKYTQISTSNVNVVRNVYKDIPGDGMSCGSRM